MKAPEVLGKSVKTWIRFEKRATLTQAARSPFPLLFRRGSAKHLMHAGLNDMMSNDHTPQLTGLACKKRKTTRPEKTCSG